MARMPDGFVFITNVSGPKVKDGQAYADVSVEERELVMCKNCRYADYPDSANPVCTVYYGAGGPDFYCAGGKRRDAADDRD